MKKLASVILSLSLILTLVPFRAFAAPTYFKLFTARDFLVNERTKTYSFTMAENGTLKLLFSFDDECDEYWEYCSEKQWDRFGCSVLITDSSDKEVYSMSSEMDEEGCVRKYADLKKGKYTVTVGTIYYDYSNAFEWYDDDEDDYDEYYDEYDMMSADGEECAVAYKLTASWKPDVTPALRGVKLSKEKLTLKKGKNALLQAKPKPEYSYLQGLKWSSSNSKVAIVSSSGKVTAKALGFAYIEVKSGKLSDKCYVKVDSMSLSAARKQTVDLKKYIKNIPGYAAAKWSCDNTSVASVSSKGIVKVKAPGKASVTVTVNGDKYKINITA